MRSTRSVRSLPADSVHHTASTLEGCTGVYIVQPTLGSGILSAGRLRTLRVLRISGRLFLWNP